MPRHSVHRRELPSPAISLVRPDRMGVRLCALLWGGELHDGVVIPVRVAYEVGRELVDTAESLLMAEGWTPVPARGAAQPGARAIRPGRAVESSR